MKSAGFRRFCTAVAKVETKEAAVAKPSPPAAAPVRKVEKTTSFGQRFGSFLAGFAVCSVVGEYFVVQDIWESTLQTELQIHSMMTQLEDTNEELRKRISFLEHTVANLKK